MMKEHRHHLMLWFALLAVAAMEFLASRLPIPPEVRQLLIIPAALMVIIVVFGFMRLASAPPIARCFALGGVVWLSVLLGLAMVDPLTRAFYAVIG